MYIMVMADEPSKRLYDYFDPEQFKDVDLMLFDKVIAYDHLKQKIVLIVNMQTDNIVPCPSFVCKGQS